MVLIARERDSNRFNFDPTTEPKDVRARAPSNLELAVAVGI